MITRAKREHHIQTAVYRGASACAALAVCALSLWCLAADLVAAMPVSLLPRDTAQDPLVSRAQLAARISFVRDDLWAAAATAQSVSATSAMGGAPPDGAAQRQKAIDDARRAVSIAPFDAPMWLLLATIDTADATAAQRLRFIKMSYYVLPSTSSDVQGRLKATADLAGRLDEELETLFRFDVAAILTRHRHLGGALMQAFRDTDNAGRDLLRRAASGVDSTFFPD